MTPEPPAHVKAMPYWLWLALKHMKAGKQRCPICGERVEKGREMDHA